MMIKLFIIILITSAVVYSQDINNKNIYLLQKGSHSSLSIKNNPKINSFNNSSNNTLFLVAGSIALTGVLFATDDGTYEIFKNARDTNPFLKKTSPIITQLGDGKFPMLLFVSFGVFHLITGDKKSGNAALLGLESFIFSGVAIQLLKHTFGRERPSNSTMDGGKWHGPTLFPKGQSLADFDAFPSGHTATIFAAASSLSYIYPNGIVPYVSYGIASLVALSRVTESTHWLSDCFIGGLIGYFSTCFLYNLQ